MIQNDGEEGVMNVGRNTAMAGVAVVGVVLVALLLFGHELAWTAVLLIVALVVDLVVALVLRRPSRPAPSWPAPDTSFTAMPSLSPQPVEHQKEHIVDVLVASTREDYYFLFSAEVLWSPMEAAADDTSTVNMAAWAIDAILTRAREITRDRDPGHASSVRHELGRALGEMREDATGLVRAMAGSVHLVLPEHDQQRLEKLAAVRKDEDIWKYERRREQSEREYLREDVLKNPGSAVVWWLTKNNDQVEKAVQDIGILTQLSSVANNMEPPESFRPFAPGLGLPHAPDSYQPGLSDSDASQSPGNEKSAADHFDAFLRAIDLAENDPQRSLLAHQVAGIVAKHGRPEVADELVHRFDAPQSLEDSWEPDDGSGEAPA